MALVEDFKKFAFKGNVIDLAVGVVIGTAFSKIVTGLVENVVMPLVSLVLPDGNWRNAERVLKAMPNPKDSVTLKYGALLASIVDFLVIAFVLFLIVTRIFRHQETKPPAEKKPEEKMVELLTEIRDGMKAR